MSSFDRYSGLYENVRIERRDGIVQLTLHDQGGEVRWEANRGGIHDQLGDAFHQVARDPENRVVILTGTGDSFLLGLKGTDLSVESDGAAFWHRIYKEGKDLLMNLLDIEVPVIGAANGPAFVHAELLAMSDIVIASERASFADKVHFVQGGVPGDGVHVWWQMVLGPNRGRHFLLTGNEIDATEALRLGLVAEVVPHERCLARAWEIATELAGRSPLVLRMTRATLVQHIKRRMLEDLGSGMIAQGMGFLERWHGASGHG